MKFKLLFICILPLYTYAQDITGVWTGYLKTPGSQLSYELAISGAGEKLNGYSLIVYLNDGIENIGIKKAKLKRKNNEIIFEDGELIYDNFSSRPVRSKLFGSVALSKKDSMIVLSGTFGTRSLDMRDERTYYGEIYLEKDIKHSLSRMLPKLEQLNLIHTLSFMNLDPKKKKTINKPITDSLITKKNPPIEIAKPKPRIEPRRTVKIRDLFFNSDSLVLSVVDNGTVDGDTISLVLNGTVIANKVGLTSRPFKTTIPASAFVGDSLQLIMYAESLGTIPPNTGLLIIEDGDIRHEIRFEGDLQKSSAIILRKTR